MGQLKGPVLLLLANDGALPAEWFDHELQGEWADHCERRIKGDLLLI
jgi:mRNA interferase YafQ